MHGLRQKKKIRANDHTGQTFLQETLLWTTQMKVQTPQIPSNNLISYIHKKASNYR